MNQQTYEKLHYFTLKEKLKSYCQSGLGSALVDRLQPSANLSVVNGRLAETTEGRKLLDASFHLPLKGISNVNMTIDKMEKGMTLEASELVSLADFLRGCRLLKQFMQNKGSYAPTLCAYSEHLSSFVTIEDEISAAIRGSEIDNNASKALAKIRRGLEQCENKIKERLEKFMKNPSHKEALQDTFISERNGHFTVPIKAAFRNHIEGALIESSAKGSTVFIEPQVIQKHTVERGILKAEESVEEFRILAELTELCFTEIHAIKQNVECVAHFDFVWAKARYSKGIDGIAPQINTHGCTTIINGKYPLLTNSVPLNFTIGEDFRTLIITGPNAGGKTVVLKTIGLLTLAVSSGLHIAADEGTEIALFDQIFVDIGDGQSVENALSTFSSHVKNLAEILSKSNKNTLLLFDEIGSGTEPNEGAALGIAVLEEFYGKGCITIATTHYGEIKNYSEQHPDFENAAMLFESETLDPLYQLCIGKSGASNALYIAQKMGIPLHIVERTKNYFENKSYNYVRKSFSKPELSKKNVEQIQQYNIGDVVLWLETNERAIVAETKDHEVIIFVKDTYETVHARRLQLQFAATELYPEGYDLSQLFISYADRKFEHDMKRGSKKALRKVAKEMKKSKE
ncbi:MAG: endonuclease MutS2 [Bacilli bacterium]